MLQLSVFVQFANATVKKTVHCYIISAPATMESLVTGESIGVRTDIITTIISTPHAPTPNITATLLLLAPLHEQSHPPSHDSVQGTYERRCLMARYSVHDTGANFMFFVCLYSHSTRMVFYDYNRNISILLLRYVFIYLQDYSQFSVPSLLKSN
jgi:hypothetical protein